MVVVVVVGFTVSLEEGWKRIWVVFADWNLADIANALCKLVEGYGDTCCISMVWW